MALGFILSALTGLFGAFFKNPITIVLFVLIVILCVSGPSMFLAWSKLRKRNLAPVLNANGWAVNAKISVNPRFGATLTDLASYPKVALKDPYAKKSMPRWLRWIVSIVVILAIVFVILYFKGYFNRYNNLQALHYDESSVVYRVTDKIFGSVKNSLEETTGDLTGAVEVVAATPDAAPAADAPAPAPAPAE